MSVTLLRAGFLTSVQDLGRSGYRATGVSVGGAVDAHALRVANLLVGNDESAAGLEVSLGTMRLLFADERLVSWCGGDFEVEAAGLKLRSGRPAFVTDGDDLQITAPASGGRAWVAISGGADVPAVLGSRATELRSRFGGFAGRLLKDGDLLDLKPENAAAVSLRFQLRDTRIASWGAPNEWCSTAPRHLYLRVVRGADSARFDESAIGELFHGTFSVREEADRMGVRLEGPTIVRIDDEDLQSEPVASGTIQIPPDGKPIVLLGDCQTIGGYPKIAHVITVDLAAASQLRPGDLVRFAEVTVGEAQHLLISREVDLDWFRAGLALKTA